MKKQNFFIFTCIDCGKEDEVPNYVVEEFHFDLEENEEVEVVCPLPMVPCESEKKDPVNNQHLGRG